MIDKTVDNRYKYMGMTKYTLIREIFERDCKLKYAFSRNKLDLIQYLHELDNGADPYRLATHEIFVRQQKKKETEKPPQQGRTRFGSVTTDEEENDDERTKLV